MIRLGVKIGSLCQGVEIYVFCLNLGLGTTLGLGFSDKGRGF